MESHKNIIQKECFYKFVNSQYINKPLLSPRSTSEGVELGFFRDKVRAGAVKRNTEHCGLVKLYI